MEDCSSLVPRSLAAAVPQLFACWVQDLTFRHFAEALRALRFLVNVLHTTRRTAWCQPHSPDPFSCTLAAACARRTAQASREGILVPLAVLDSFDLGLQRQVVGPVELLLVLIAKMPGPHKFAGRRVVTFIDGDSARYALIAGCSLSMASSRIIAASSTLDGRLAIYQRIARVPSESNPADGLSRREFGDNVEQGSRTTELLLDNTTGNRFFGP